jgi:hypothetical protein
MKRSAVYLGTCATAALIGLGCAPVGGPLEPEPSAAPTAAAPAPAPLPPPRLTEANAGLKERLQAAIRNVRQRDLLVSNSFWTIFHGILGVGSDATLLDPDSGLRVNAIDYIRRGGSIRGLKFLPTPTGLDVRTGPQFVGQGHQDQFVAEMAQWGMPLDATFQVDGKQYTFADFIRHAKARASVSSDQELSWAVLILGQYVGTDIRWTNGNGEELKFEDLVRYELNQPIDTAACGGTHRLFGLSWVYHLHLQKGGATTGVWKDVADNVKHYQQLARKYQNPDGSLSTSYLNGPGDARDMQARIGTTGHVLEWLALSLSDEELRSPWVQQATSALSVMILDSQGSPVEGGSLYHAAHGLQIYHDRVFGPVEAGHPRPLIPRPPEQLPLPSPN